jgi:prepilin-type N-terminal cleavage/methylation domain-containing protein
MRGFTLIEMLVVIGIVGILLGLSIISVRWYIYGAKLTEVRDQFIADLEFVKLQSITKVPNGIYLYNNKYEIRVLNDTNGNFIRDTAENTTVNNTINLPSNLTLTWTTCNGDKELWFDRKGIPRCKDWEYGDGQISFIKSGNTKTIKLEKTGRIQYE